MAFVNLIFASQKLKKLQKTLIEEKTNSLQRSKDPKHRQKFKFRHLTVDLRERVKKLVKKLFFCSREGKFCYKLNREGSCENYTLKSVLGFFGGVFLTYLLYFLFIFQLNVKLTSATVICASLGCVLTVGLAFSSRIRCIVLLTLPQFFSKRGRQALLAYAFVLALTGPAQNTLDNLGILSESLACGQEQLKQAVKQIIDVIKKPFKAIKEAIKKVVKTVKEIVKKIKEILLKIKRVIMSIVRVIKSVFEFLGRIINICNKELGTPFQRCTRVFENAIADCNAKLGPLFSWLCSLAYIVKAVCYLVKMFDYVCMVVDFISNSVVGVIIKKVKTFVRHIKTMFYVRIKFSHSFEYQTVASKSYKEIARGIVAEIKERSGSIVAFFNFMTSASMLFFMYLIFQVAYYRFKYLTSERFDNVYITRYFREIDRRRAKAAKETVLPLTKKEKVIYVPINGGSLSKLEKKSVSKSAYKLATASVKLGTHMAVDYCLYWVLNLISHHARYQSKVQAPNLPVAHITGDGFLAVLLRSIVNAFQPVGIKLEIDTVPCLPVPIRPDLDRYIQIVVTIGICWVLTILEPYGLRFRNYIMGYYHPLRAKQRTIWLYNHILRSRTTFLMLARRKLRRKFGAADRTEISCKELLRSKLRCTIFKICLGSDLQLTCLLCGEVYREKDKSQFIKCPTPQCPGLFCVECFADLKNICPVCLSPLEYGDLEDLDQEKDSSGDEAPPKKKKKKCPAWLLCGKTGEDNEKVEEDDSSSNYSYSYQDEEVKDEELESQTTWRDLEQQTIPDEASMEVFHEEEEEESLYIDLDNRIKVPAGYKGKVKMEVSVIDEENDVELLDVGLDSTIGKDGKTKKEESYCECPSSNRKVEFIGLPLEDVHRKIRRLQDSDCDCSDYPKSTMSTSTRSDCLFCACPDVELRSTLLAGAETEEELLQVVPRLDLSFLEKACSCSDNPVLSTRFSSVTYREESETPASGRSLDSSSVLTGLEVRNRPELRCRRVDGTVVPPCHQNTTEKNHKVQEYYHKTRLLCLNQELRKKEKRRSIGDMFRKLLPKRNKLPYHRGDLEDAVEIKSFNYQEKNWENIDLDSPTYPFNSSSGSEEEEEEGKPLLGSRRIRGGQCTHVIQSTAKRFDPKSRSELKDFSTLSLPPKPKPPDTKQFISEYLFKIEDFTRKSMKSEEVLAENQENETAPLTPASPSSDSGLSGSICLQLFGQDCPGRFQKEEEVEVPASEEEEVNLHVLKESSGIKVSSGEVANLSGSGGKVVFEEAPNCEEKSVSGLVVVEEDPPSRQASKTSRTSTQLNQLLYKDERTEISLVQQLNPEKIPPRKPSVKLQINLHNSLLPEELEMKSPRSQDKMIGTTESFPLHSDWSGGGKTAGNTDQTQQTSENDIYKRFSGLSRLPEKDPTPKCQCSNCLISRLQSGGSCKCCQCNSPGIPEVLPPPPPPPPRRYICQCCMYHYRYPPPPDFYPQEDLPYQNNNDYLDLVQELEETLHSRNRNRVKRAMQEFESRSKQNKPLEKPIIDYDEGGDSEEVIRRIDQISGRSKGYKSGLRYGRAGQGSRWRMDPDSGEWQKNDSTQTNRTGRNGKSREGQSGDFCCCSCNCQRKFE